MIDYPLVFAHRGEILEVKTCRGNRQQEERFQSMGIQKGSLLRIVQENAGTLLIAVNENRIALSRGLAQLISVSPIALGSHGL